MEERKRECENICRVVKSHSRRVFSTRRDTIFKAACSIFHSLSSSGRKKRRASKAGATVEKAHGLHIATVLSRQGS